MTADNAEIIRTLENNRFDAIVARDFDKFAELAHPDLAYTHSNGALDTLSSYLDKCKNGYYVYHQIDHPIDTITVVGDTAVVIGEMNADLTAGGVRKQLANRSLAVWTRVDGTWKFLAYQPTVKQG
ncbi:ketosteroid isomerase [Streptomyces incarnatus]|uniref:Ketosteroid isomerase n=1 Tax=Streptomyces incarnatus TaxID=665007 RepID=A0ABM5TC19_9ACTN|nr:nuclear transport factor 2 family protein [Streptomyces incarnatus]AKJ08522.1 ketosteroid isomerase [Streptomyces incarnatus]